MNMIPVGFCYVYNVLLISFRPTWCHTLVFTSLWPLMLQSSQQRKLIMNSWVLLKSPMPALSQPIRWWNVTHVMVNIWPVVCCTVVMWFQRMWMQLLQQSRPREPFSLLIGVQLDLRWLSCIYIYIFFFSLIKGPLLFREWWAMYCYFTKSKVC